MQREEQGKYVDISTTGVRARAFVPADLPIKPPIDWTPTLRENFDQALLALGRLDSVSMLLPDTSLFLYMYVRKEAVLSSMIEGTQSSLCDLLMYEFEHLASVLLDDVEEVSQYVAALYHGLKRLKEGFPISLRLLREIHAVLLAKGRGENCTPGVFRKSQNWIGGACPIQASYVPPPPSYVQPCMANLELFLNDQPEKTHALVKAAIAHLQFESIHPFLDGNGRLGRLIITLLLCSEKVLKEPMLYLSLYFKTHRQRYYELLNGVRQTGDWETWLNFFAEAVIHTATQAVDTTRQLLKLSADDGQRINALKRISGSATLVHKVLLERPIASPNWIQDKTQLSPATVNACLRVLEKLGIVKEVTGQKRNRLYAYPVYLQIMNEGIEVS